MEIVDGCISIKGYPEFKHVKVVSESDSSKYYYVTVDAKRGVVVGCTCPAAATKPFIKCKHQMAVINQRLLQTGR